MNGTSSASNGTVSSYLSPTSTGAPLASIGELLTLDVIQAPLAALVALVSAASGAGTS